MSRRLAVLAAALVACSVLAPAAFATDASAADHEIDSCTVIDDPGEYELVEDVETDQEASCIEIESGNVTLDGNGHTITGPGADRNGTGIDVESGSRDVEIRNLVIEGWETGVYAGGNYELSDAVVRDSETGLEHNTGGADALSNVTIEGNDLGIDSQMGGVRGSDVTVRENGNGIFAFDGGNYHLTDAEIVDNEGYGARIEHSGYMDLADSTVSGNGAHGVFLSEPGYSVNADVENTTITGNGGDGVRVVSDTHEPVQLVDVTVADNDGAEVNAAAPHPYRSDPARSEGTITATNLAVGSSATTDFEDEPIRLEPVDSDDLPPRDGGTAVGDGLNVSGNVSGPVDLELDVDTDDETVDLWRHDGSEWETVEEDLDAADSTVEATVETEGLYAPGTDDEQDDSGDDQNETDGEDDQQDSGDDSQDDSGDDSQEDDTGDDSQDDSGDDSQDDSEPSDQDGEKKKDDTETPTEGSSCGCDASSEGSDGSEATDSPTPTPGNESTTGNESMPEDDEQQQVDDEDDDGDAGGDAANDDTEGDGPGFTGVAALVALLGSALLVRRRA